jgi:hypothetical protein
MVCKYFMADFFREIAANLGQAMRKSNAGLPGKPLGSRRPASLLLICHKMATDLT